MDFSNNFLVKLLNTNHRNKKYTDLIGNLFFMEENPDDDKILLSDLETFETLDISFDQIFFGWQSDKLLKYTQKTKDEEDILWDFEIIEVYKDGQDSEEEEEEEVVVMEVKETKDDELVDIATKSLDISDNLSDTSGSYITDYVEIGDDSIEMIGVITKISALSKWERQYSDKEYKNGILDNLKKIYKKKNLIFLENKTDKLLNMIKTSAVDFNLQSNINYHIKQNIIIPYDETDKNRNKYYNVKKSLIGLEFTPYDFTNKHEKLILTINNVKINILFSVNIQNIEDCVKILRQNTKLLVEIYKDNLKISYKLSDAKIILSSLSGKNVIKFFGRLSVFKSNLELLSNNHFNNSYLIPIVDDKKKMYVLPGDETGLLEDESNIDSRDTITTTDFEIENKVLNNLLKSQKTENIGSNSGIKEERTEFNLRYQNVMHNDMPIVDNENPDEPINMNPINKPYINLNNDSIKSIKVRLNDDTFVIRNKDTLSLNNDTFTKNSFQKRKAEGINYSIYDDLNPIIPTKAQINGNCMGTMSEKAFSGQSDYILKYNNTPFFKEKKQKGYRGEQINIIGFHIKSFHKFKPDFSTTGIKKSYILNEDNENIYYHYDEYPICNNIGYDLIDQCRDNILNIKESYGSKTNYEYFNNYQLSDDTDLTKIFNQTDKEIIESDTGTTNYYELLGNNFMFPNEEFDDDKYNKFLNLLLPSMEEIFKIEEENLNHCNNIRDINKVLQKYFTNIEDIDNTNPFVYNLLTKNRIFYKKIIKYQENIYKYSKNFFNKVNQLNIKIDKIVLYNKIANTPKSIMIENLVKSVKSDFTINDLINYMNLIGINSSSISFDKAEDLSDKHDKTLILYNEIVNLIVSHKMNMNKSVYNSELIYIYINDNKKKKENIDTKRLANIFKLYNIDLKDLKKFNTNNYNSYEVFKSKFLYKLNKTFDNGTLFYKYIQNKNLYKQLNYFKNITDFIISKNIDESEQILKLLKQSFYDEKEKHRYFIKECENNKIVKVYGNIKDLFYDNKPGIYKDSKFDTLSQDRELIENLLKTTDKTLSEEELKTVKYEYLKKIYILSSDEDIKSKLEQLDICSSTICRSIIQNNDIALLKNIGVRLLAGTKVNHNDEEYLVYSVNSDSTYDLQSDKTKNIINNIKSKYILNYEDLITDLNTTKRILYKRFNNIWIPITKEDFDNNKCILDKFQTEILDKDWDEIIEFFSGKNYDIDDESGESSIRRLADFKVDVKKTGLYNFLNFNTLKKEEVCIPDEFYFFLINMENLINKIEYYKDIQYIKNNYMKMIKENIQYINQNLRVEKKEIEYINISSSEKSTIPENLLKKYRNIHQNLDFDEKYDLLKDFVRKYGRKSIGWESDKYIYWDYKTSEPLCCIHHIDLIDMVHVDNKDERLQNFIQKYTVNADGHEFSDEGGKYCKFCSEKIDYIKDLNYLADYEAHPSNNEFSKSMNISLKYNERDKLIYDSVLELFPFTIKFNELDMDFIIAKTVEFTNEFSLNNSHENKINLKIYEENYYEQLINLINVTKKKSAFKTKKKIYPEDLTSEDILELKRKFYENFDELTIDNLNLFEVSLGQVSELDGPEIVIQRHELKKQVHFYSIMLKRLFLQFDTIVQKNGGHGINTPNNNLIKITKEIRKLSVIVSLVAFIIYISDNKYKIIIGDERKEGLKNLGTKDMESIKLTLLEQVKNKYFKTEISNTFSIVKSKEPKEKKEIDDKFNSFSLQFINRFLIVSNIKTIPNLKELNEKYGNDIFLYNFNEINKAIVNIPFFADKIDNKLVILHEDKKYSAWNDFRPLLKPITTDDDDIDIIVSQIEELDIKLLNNKQINKKFHLLARSLIDKINKIIKDSSSDTELKLFTSYLSSCCQSKIQESYLDYFKSGINISNLYTVLDNNKKLITFTDYTDLYESNQPIPENYTLLDYMYYSSESSSDELLLKKIEQINLNIVTDLFTNDVTLLGKKRNFKKIFDRDIFLLQDIYQANINIPDSDLKELLKSKIEEKYNFNSITSLKKSTDEFNSSLDKCWGKNLSQVSILHGPITPISEEFIQKKIEFLLQPFNGSYEIDTLTGDYKHDIINKVKELEEITYEEKILIIENLISSKKRIIKNSDYIITPLFKNKSKDEYINNKHLQEAKQVNSLLKSLFYFGDKNWNNIIITNPESFENMNNIQTLIDTYILEQKVSFDIKSNIQQYFYDMKEQLNILGLSDTPELKNISEYTFNEQIIYKNNLLSLLNIENYGVNIDEERKYRINNNIIKYTQTKIKLLKNSLKFMLTIIKSSFNKIQTNKTYITSNLNLNNEKRKKTLSLYKIYDTKNIFNYNKTTPYWHFKHKNPKTQTCKCPLYTSINIFETTEEVTREGRADEHTRPRWSSDDVRNLYSNVIYKNTLEKVDLFLSKMNDSSDDDPEYQTKYNYLKKFLEDKDDTNTNSDLQYTEYECINTLINKLCDYNCKFNKTDILFNTNIILQIINYLFLYVLKFVEVAFDDDVFNLFKTLFYEQLLFTDNKLKNKQNIFEEIITIKTNASLLRKKDYDELTDDEKLTKMAFRSVNLGNQQTTLESDDSSDLITGNPDLEHRDGVIYEGTEQIDYNDFSNNFEDPE